MEINRSWDAANPEESTRLENDDKYGYNLMRNYADQLNEVFEEDDAEPDSKT